MKKLQLLKIMSVFTLLLGANYLFSQIQSIYTKDDNGSLNVIKLSIVDNKAKMISKSSISQTIYQEFSRAPGTEQEKLTAMNSPRNVIRIADTHKKIYSQWGMWFTKQHFQNTIVYLPEGESFHEKSVPWKIDEFKRSWSVYALYITLFLIFVIIGREAKLDSKTHDPTVLFGVVAVLVVVELGISFGEIHAFIFLFFSICLGAIVLLSQYSLYLKKKVLFGFKKMETALRVAWGLAGMTCLLFSCLTLAIKSESFEFEYSISYFISLLIEIPIIAFLLGYFLTKNKAEKEKILLKKKEAEIEREKTRQRNKIIDEVIKEVKKPIEKKIDPYDNIGKNSDIIG